MVFTVCMQTDRTEQPVAYEVLPYLPLIKQCLDTKSGSKLYLFKFLKKYGNMLRCPNSYGKYGSI